MESPFSVVDAVVIIFTFLSTILAMARGITREVLGVASFIGASFLAIYSADIFAPILTSFVNLQPIADKFSGDSSVIANWLTGGLLFIIYWIIFTVITSKLARFINNSAVSGIDSTLGFIFGIVRGLFIVGIVYTMYTHFIPPEKYHATVTKAKLKPVLDETSELIIDFSSLVLPEYIAEGFMRRPRAEYSDSSSTSDIVNAIKSPNEINNNTTPEDILKQLKE
ncbi:MAG: membrane protein required for colicin V production [Alphaproteobacteria bacterium]|jgi:membrane protein required for colicin V production